ncbi:MAG: PAS domain-containing protein [Verrucomicrobiota bacterium]
MTESSIRRQLLAAMLIVSSSVLLLTGLVLISYEFTTYRTTTVRHLAGLARTVASYSTAALAYQDEKGAHEILSGFRSEPDIVVACLYDQSGKPFATYRPGKASQPFPPKPGTDGFRFSRSELVLFQPVIQGNARMGTLYVRQNLSSMYSRIATYAMFVVFVLGLSVTVAFFLSRFFELKIAGPILSLAQTARRISEHKDFSIRAQKEGGPELGLLTQAFNQMLSEIQTRQQQLLSELSARERAELALRASEEELRFVTDHASVIILHCDRELRLKFVNRPYAARFGMAPEAVLGKRIPEVVGAAAFDSFKVYIERALAGESLMFEVKIPYETLGERWMLCALTPEQSRDGVVPGFVAVVQDVTDRHEMQEALRESEERFRLLADNILQLAWIADKDGFINWYNKRWYEYTGTTLAQMQGRGWEQVQHPDHLARVRQKFDEFLRRGVVWEDTFPLLGKDGQYRWFLSRALPVRDEHGEIVRWFGTNTDITDLRQAQEALRQAHFRLQTTLDGMNDAFVIYSRAWKFLVVNPAATRMWNEPAEALLGQSLWEKFPELRATKLYPKFVQSMEQRAPTTFQFHHPGVDRWFEHQCYPIEEGLAVFTADITARKNAQQILERTVDERTAELRETVGELEAFSYSISHDMRAPLRAITSYSEALVEDFGNQLPPAAKSHLNSISSAAVRLDQLITDVLAYSRVSRAERELEPVEIEPLIRELAEQYPSLQSPRAEIRIQTPLPTVLGHRASLAQCLSNLLTNAAKFVQPGVKPVISIRAEPAPAPAQILGQKSPDLFVRIWIEDNGIGVPAKDLDRIFRIFERVHPPQIYEGTGIGLAIVKKAMERMGGQVGVESTMGQGSRFWIELRKA